MMNSSRQHIDSVIFERFTPLCDLDADTLDKLARHATIETVAAGDFLFERGDASPRTLYLLEGEVELCSPLSPTQTISAGTEAGRYPLAHAFPKQFTAVTVSDVRVLILPLDISEILSTDGARPKAASNGETVAAWEKRWLESPMLRRLKNSHKKALLAGMEEITVQAGSVIIHQGEEADSYYVIKKGHCSVSRKPTHGARDIKLAELTEGQGFGEEALITNIPRNASVTMLSDGILLRLGKEDFIKLMAKPLLHLLPFPQAMQLVEKGAVLIDVRTPEEFEIDGLVGSLNMPIPVLRLKANRLNRDRIYIVYSNTGQTSSVAVFLLIQQGLNAYVLEGGLLTAPKYRMKRGGFGEQGTSENTSTNNTVLPFPNSSTQKPGAVDWQNVSDDVLWRTTLGFREDSGVEAALTPKPASSTPQGDNTLQGFDDIRLFTKIDTMQGMTHAQNENPRGVFSESNSAGHSRPRTAHNRPSNPPAPHRYNPTPQWNDRSSPSLVRRLILSIVAAVVLLGGGIGIYYFAKGELPGNLDAASPMLQDQQRKLDDKVNRLLDAIESLPALQRHAKDPKGAAPAGGDSKDSPAAGKAP